MFKRLMTGVLAIIGASSLAGAAQAVTPSYTTANVNMRAGPGTSYPVLVTVPNRTSITTHGCLENYNWCDVSWGTERGWMSASYIQVTYQGQPVIVTPAIAPAIGLTVVVYNRAYWDRYYYGRPWYKNWDRYYRPPPRRHAVQPILPPRGPKANPPRPNRPVATQPILPRGPKANPPRPNRPVASNPIMPRGPKANPPRPNRPVASNPIMPRGPKANSPRPNRPIASNPRPNRPIASQPRPNRPQVAQPRQRRGARAG